MLKKQIAIVITCFISTSVFAKTTIDLGHYYVDAPTQDYRLSSLSLKNKQLNWAGKISIPYIQTHKGQNGIGNILVKLSQQWRLDNFLIRGHFKQKLATAKSEVVTPVTDRAFSIEASYGFSWGLGFMESGYWWREDTSYKRDNTWYGSLGMIKAFSAYAAGIMVDHKPTALGEQDSMFSVLFKKTIFTGYAITLLIGTGLNQDSPKSMFGLQLSHKIKGW